MNPNTTTNDYEPIVFDELIGITGLMLSEDVFCSIASEKVGVLPHDIADKSILFIDRKANYKKDDYIVIKDSRVRKNGYRITKALSDKDKDFVGRLIASIKIYWGWNNEVENWKRK